MAEYEFVSSLIPFYRRMEVTALAGTGLLLSAIIAALAAIEAAANPNRTAEGLLLSTGAWVPAFLLLIEIMALTRLRRASLYIREDLHDLAVTLTGEAKILMWEHSPTTKLVDETAKRRRIFLKKVEADKRKLGENTLLGEGHSGSRLRWPFLAAAGWMEKVFAKDRLVENFASSTPLIVAMAVASGALAVSGAVVNFNALTLVIGGLGAFVAVGLASYGIAFTLLHEKPQKPASSDSETAH